MDCFVSAVCTSRNNPDRDCTSQRLCQRRCQFAVCFEFLDKIYSNILVFFICSILLPTVVYRAVSSVYCSNSLVLLDHWRFVALFIATIPVHFLNYSAYIRRCISVSFPPYTYSKYRNTIFYCFFSRVLLRKQLSRGLQTSLPSQLQILQQ